jgi:sulfide:quinone oxidoreductase
VGGGPPHQPLNVLIVGGGVAALEAMLALRHLAEARVDLTLLCPESDFRIRPVSVAVPFGRGEVHSVPIADLTTAVGARLVRAVLREVDATRRQVLTDAGDVIAYDALIVACGARRQPVLKGSLTFTGEEDVGAVKELLQQLSNGTVSRVVFALPQGASWALPLYELALLTATYVSEQRLAGVSLALVTPEQRPLDQFGGDVSIAVAQLLHERHINVHTSTRPIGVYDDGLIVAPPGRLLADRVVSVPQAFGTPIAGIPHNHAGFIATDELGRVRELEAVYAIGDITTFPIKQGGIAAQQADLVAQVLAKQAGAPLDDPAPLRPVLRGLLLTGDASRYLVAVTGPSHGDTASVSTEPLWSPEGKIAAQHLSRYLIHEIRT